MNKRKNAERFAITFSLVSIFILAIFIVALNKITKNIETYEQKIKTVFSSLKSKKIENKDIPDRKKIKIKISKKLKELRPEVDIDLKYDFGLDSKDISVMDLDNVLLTAKKEVVMDESSVDKAPRVLEKKPIVFPKKARDDNISNGEVEVRLLINKEGRVENSEIVSSGPQGYFEDVTLAAVYSWKFDPAIYKGKPVFVWINQVVKFDW
ncbi:MAG: energy transducer TonB [Halobacteriovoraceae bacterium]|nr:energy transducer TonB [Halobacteriovoraceae bacterium]